jgi:hypothetical protein
MRTIDPIAHIGGRGDRLESVRKAGRNVQMPEVVVVDRKCLLPTEGGGCPLTVDEHIVHDVGATDQLGRVVKRLWAVDENVCEVRSFDAQQVRVP